MLQAAAERLEAQLYDLAGERFNLQARHQLSRIMFDKLQLKTRDPNVNIPITSSGYKSTSMVSGAEAVGKSWSGPAPASVLAPSQQHHPCGQAAVFCALTALAEHC